MVAAETVLATMGCFFCCLCSLGCLSQRTPRDQQIPYYGPEIQEQYGCYEEDPSIQELFQLRRQYQERLRLVDNLVERKKKETLGTYIALHNLTTPARGLFPFARRYTPEVVLY